MSRRRHGDCSKNMASLPKFLQAQIALVHHDIQIYFLPTKALEKLVLGGKKAHHQAEVMQQLTDNPYISGHSKSSNTQRSRSHLDVLTTCRHDRILPLDFVHTGRYWHFPSTSDLFTLNFLCLLHLFCWFHTKHNDGWIIVIYDDLTASHLRPSGRVISYELACRQALFGFCYGDGYRAVTRRNTINQSRIYALYCT